MTQTEWLGQVQRIEAAIRGAREQCKARELDLLDEIDQLRTRCTLLAARDEERTLAEEAFASTLAETSERETSEREALVEGASAAAAEVAAQKQRISALESENATLRRREADARMELAKVAQAATTLARKQAALGGWLVSPIAKGAAASSASLASHLAAPPPPPPPRLSASPTRSAPIEQPVPEPAKGGARRRSAKVGDIPRMKALFDQVDKDGDGVNNVREMNIGLRKLSDLSTMLCLPHRIHQEDGTRNAFETTFQGMDRNGDREITWEEFLLWFLETRAKNGIIGTHGDAKSHNGHTTAISVAAAAVPVRAPAAHQQPSEYTATARTGTAAAYPANTASHKTDWLPNARPTDILSGAASEREAAGFDDRHSNQNPISSPSLGEILKKSITESKTRGTAHPAATAATAATATPQQRQFKGREVHFRELMPDQFVRRAASSQLAVPPHSPLPMPAPKPTPRHQLRQDQIFLVSSGASVAASAQLQQQQNMQPSASTAATTAVSSTAPPGEIAPAVLAEITSKLSAKHAEQLSALETSSKLAEVAAVQAAIAAAEENHSVLLEKAERLMIAEHAEALGSLETAHEHTLSLAKAEIESSRAFAKNAFAQNHESTTIAKSAAITEIIATLKAEHAEELSVARDAAAAAHAANLTQVASLNEAATSEAVSKAKDAILAAHAGQLLDMQVSHVRDLALAKAELESSYAGMSDKVSRAATAAKNADMAEITAKLNAEHGEIFSTLEPSNGEAEAAAVQVAAPELSSKMSTKTSEEPAKTDHARRLSLKQLKEDTEMEPPVPPSGPPAPPSSLPTKTPRAEVLSLPSGPPSRKARQPATLIDLIDNAEDEKDEVPDITGRSYGGMDDIDEDELEAELEGLEVELEGVNMNPPLPPSSSLPPSSRPSPPSSPPPGVNVRLVPYQNVVEEGEGEGEGEEPNMAEKQEPKSPMAEFCANNADWTSPEESPRSSNGERTVSPPETMQSNSPTQSLTLRRRVFTTERPGKGQRGSLVERMMQSESGLGIGFEMPGTPYEGFPKNMMSSRVSSTYSVTGSSYGSSGDETDDAKGPPLVEF
jgi:hypothetical protein